jgi:predicted RND superfamily exporter protein
VVVLIAVVGLLVDFPIHMILRFQNEYKQNNERKWKTFSELRYALAFPLILAILSGIPLLNTSLILIRKTGEYIIVLSLVSYSVSVFILPNMLRFYCHHFYLKSSYCKNSTIIENENILFQ